MLQRLSFWLKAAVEAFLPFSCHVCRVRTPPGTILCDDCRRRIAASMHEPAIVEDVACRCPVMTFGAYVPPLSAAVKVVKYKPSTRLLTALSGEIARVAALMPAADRPDILIPVPLHPSREAKRGFNQARLLAEILAESWKAAVSPAIIRIRNTKPQAECDETLRATNPAGAFTLAESLIPSAFAGKRLAVIDDVATTGATLDACAAAVERLRPASLRAVVWAHSYRQSG